MPDKRFFVFVWCSAATLGMLPFWGLVTVQSWFGCWCGTDAEALLLFFTQSLTLISVYVF